MSRRLQVEPLTRAAFAPFGDVLEAAGPAIKINGGRCDRHNDLAQLDFGGPGGRAIVSVFRSRPISLPYAVSLMERHPLGSQAFSPMTGGRFLVLVAPDEEGAPGRPRAFLTRSGQGVNLHRGVWHGPLAPLRRSGSFLVVDRGGAPADNLEEHVFSEPFVVEAV